MGVQTRLGLPKQAGVLSVMSTNGVRFVTERSSSLQSSEHSLLCTNVQDVLNERSETTFDFVKSVTKKGEKLPSSSGFWVWEVVAVVISVISVIFSPYVAVAGLLIAGWNVSQSRDIRQATGRNGGTFAISIAILILCFLLLILSTIVMGLAG
jgi:hypothetical protein